MRGDSHFLRRYCGVTDRPDYGNRPNDEDYKWGVNDMKEASNHLTDDQRKMLTLYLGDCWHEISGLVLDFHCSCGAKMMFASEAMDHQLKNRTFITESDMMALYRAIWKARKWEDFCEYAYEHYEARWKRYDGKLFAWIICLSGEGYEERCGMVADWLESR